MYLCGGMLAGICSLMLALTPHTQAALTAGVLVYNGMAGITYAAFTAWSFQFAGLESDSSNSARTFRCIHQWRNCVHDVARRARLPPVRSQGTVLVDGLAAIVSAILLLFFLFAPE